MRMTIRSWDRANVVQDLNTVGAFLARRDLPALTRESMKQQFGSDRADLLILLGNSILYTAEQAAEAYRNGLVQKMMIVGGIGHSTRYLCDAVRSDSRFKRIPVDGRSEAEILYDVVGICMGTDVAGEIVLETESTNCGNNAEYALNLARQYGMCPKTVLLLQDPTMQLRSHASFLRAWSNTGARFASWAAFTPIVEEQEGDLRFRNIPEAHPVWTMERYLSLVMGETPRLHDDEHGYGPKGRGFIAHVDIPVPVLEAYERLKPSLAAFERKPES